MTYIDPATRARIANLPKNVRIVPGAPKPAPKPTELEVWKDGFGVGLFFGGLMIEALLHGLTWING